MKRDLQRLADETFDLVIIGGGIYGVCVAWEAARRGLSVALLEKADFGWATSANSLKVIHGGLRYLQHGDIRRARRSIRERRFMMSVAPHLVHPMPVLVPTYGHGLQGIEVLTAGVLINDLISFDRNQLDDPQKKIPNGRFLSRAACLSMAPNIRREGLSGAVLFHDAQVYNSERLTLAFLQSAIKAGAVAANYAEVRGVLWDADKVGGVKVYDQLADERFDVRARAVINATGPWHGQLLSSIHNRSQSRRHQLSKSFNVITTPLFDHVAVGLSSQKEFRDADMLIARKTRLLFAAPWRGKSLVGTEYTPFHGDPDDWSISDEEIDRFLVEVNSALARPFLTRDDVAFVHGGLLPIDDYDPSTQSVKLTKHYHVRDHGPDGALGLYSVVGVKYTTARYVAEQVVTAVGDSWGQTLPAAEEGCLVGGEIDRFDAFEQDVLAKRPFGLPATTLQRLIYNYGSQYSRVLNYLPSSVGEPVEDLHVWVAETRHAVHEEMACKLSDVVLRRTELGSAGRPDEETLYCCAQTMAQELGWASAKVDQELAETNRYFPQATAVKVLA